MKSILGLSIKNYIFIIIGLIIYTIGYSAFLVPCRLTGIGISGLATVIYFGLHIPIGVSILVLNAILILMSMKILGRRFVMITIICTVLSSVMFSLIQPMFTEQIVDDILLNTFLGIVITGIGVGMTIYNGGNTGGTDIIILMIMKFRNIAYGKFSTYINVLIIASSWLVVPDIEKLIYSYVYMFGFSFVTDIVINGYRQTYQIMIFSDRSNVIGDRISNEIKRGVTIIKAAGWYSKKDKDVLLVMAHRTDKHDIMQIIKEEDPKAFISIAKVEGVFGQNFDELKKV